MIPIPSRYERWIFAAVAVVTLYPILLNHYFTSGDGPAHLYNARLTLDLLNGNPLVETFHRFNSFPVPNWISNVFLTPLCAIFPSYLAEKILLVAYCLLLPYSFRYLITALKGTAISSYLIFPFVFSFMFQLGFYNFSIAVILLFFSLGYYFTHSKTFRLTQLMALGILAVATYFSHIFVATMLVAILIAAHVRGKLESFIRKEIPLATAFKSIFILVVSLLPALTLIVAFFVVRPSATDFTYLPTSELLHDIIGIRPIYNSAIEKLFAYGFFAVLMVYLVLVLFRKKSIAESRSIALYIVGAGIFWMWLCLGLLLLYFTSPDGDGWAGYVSMRTLYLLCVFFILWLSLQHVSEKALHGIVLAALVLHIGLLGKKNGFMKRNQYRFTELAELAPAIEPGKTLIPVIVSDEWNIGHISNYVGCLREVIVLENYEAATGYFPIAWQPEAPSVTIGTLGPMKVPNDWNPGNGKSVPADFVLLVGKPDAKAALVFKNLFEQLDQSYYLQKETNFFSLYHLK